MFGGSHGRVYRTGLWLRCLRLAVCCRPQWPACVPRHGPAHHHEALAQGQHSVGQALLGHSQLRSREGHGGGGEKGEEVPWVPHPGLRCRSRTWSSAKLSHLQSSAGAVFWAKGNPTGGTSPRFCTRLPPPPPSRSGPKAPRGGGGASGGGGLAAEESQQRGQNFRAPSAPPYVWPVAIDPWELSGPGGPGGGGGESRTGTEETSLPPW